MIVVDTTVWTDLFAGRTDEPHVAGSPKDPRVVHRRAEHSKTDCTVRAKPALTVEPLALTVEP